MISQCPASPDPDRRSKPILFKRVLIANLFDPRPLPTRPGVGDRSGVQSKSFPPDPARCQVFPYLSYTVGITTLTHILYYRHRAGRPASAARCTGDARVTRACVPVYPLFWFVFVYTVIGPVYSLINPRVPFAATMCWCIMPPSALPAHV